MVDVLDGYCFHIVCRIGLAAKTPAMQMGEIGFDTDERVFRIGNDTVIPERIMCSNSKIAFEYPYVPYVKFKDLRLYDGGKIAGVDISALSSAGPGILAIDDSGKLKVVELTSGDTTVSITNANGLYGNPDLRTVTTSSGLSTLTTTSSFTGIGTVSSPLTLAQATTTKLGGVQEASSAEALTGIGNKYVSSSALNYVLQDATTIAQASLVKYGVVKLATVAEALAGSNSTHAITPYSLQQVLATGITGGIDTTASFTGNGTSANPLTLEQATTVMIGGVILATPAETLVGSDNTKYITPSLLYNRLINYAPLVSPSLTGTPTTTTPGVGDNSTQIANTAWVNTALSNSISALVNSSPAVLDTLNELASALGNDPNFATSMATALGNKVSTTRTITTTGLLTGGGNLSADRTFDVPAATNAEAVAGTLTTKVITPASLKAFWLSLPTYAASTVQILGGGLATGGGDLTTTRTITVTAATNEEAIAGVDPSLVITPVTLANVLTSLNPVLSSRQVLTTGLATGGGDLLIDRTITVTAATNAEAVAGTDTTTAMTPASTRAAILDVDVVNSGTGSGVYRDRSGVDFRLNNLLPHANLGGFTITDNAAGDLVFQTTLGAGTRQMLTA